jgi:glucose uptake protein GlcU
MPKYFLIPRKNFVNFVVAKEGRLDTKLTELKNKLSEHGMLALAFYIKNDDILAIVAKPREREKEFEVRLVRLVNEQLEQLDYFVANANVMFTDYDDVFKNASIGVVSALWILAKMKRYMEKKATEKTVLAFFYNTEDEKLYVLAADDYGVELYNITDILWDP